MINCILSGGRKWELVCLRDKFTVIFTKAIAALTDQVTGTLWYIHSSLSIFHHIWLHSRLLPASLAQNHRKKRILENTMLAFSSVSEAVGGLAELRDKQTEQPSLRSYMNLCLKSAVPFPCKRNHWVLLVMLLLFSDKPSMEKCNPVFIDGLTVVDSL